MDNPLRLQARLNEVERQIASHRFRLGALKWLGVPVMALVVGYLCYFVYTRNVGLTSGLVAGFGGVATTLMAGMGGYRSLRRHLRGLEEERAELHSWQTPGG